jgi:hypothetical protein
MPLLTSPRHGTLALSCLLLATLSISSVFAVEMTNPDAPRLVSERDFDFDLPDASSETIRPHLSRDFDFDLDDIDCEMQPTPPSSTQASNSPTIAHLPARS